MLQNGMRHSTLMVNQSTPSTSVHSDSFQYAAPTTAPSSKPTAVRASALPCGEMDHTAVSHVRDD